MKSLLKLFIMALALGLIFSGCKKDDDNSSSQNYFKVGDTQYELSAATLLGWEETNVKGVFDVDLALYSKDIKVTSPTVTTGEGNILYFQMYSSSLTDLPDGSYSYGLESNQKAGVLWAADAMINYDFATEESDKNISLKSGTVTVSKSGSEYTINITATGASGETITGYYKGTLTKY